MQKFYDFKKPPLSILLTFYKHCKWWFIFFLPYILWYICVLQKGIILLFTDFANLKTTLILCNKVLKILT